MTPTDIMITKMTLAILIPLLLLRLLLIFEVGGIQWAGLPLPSNQFHSKGPT